MLLAELIKRKRAQHGLSQQELANKTGVSRNLIYKIEGGGNSNVTVDTVVALAKGLRVSPQVILYAAMEGMQMDRGLDVSQWLKGTTDG